MSVRTMARVWDQSQHSGTELLMLLALADFADDDGNSYPAVPTLAAKCRMTPRNANHILAALRASGELEVLLNEGPRGTNRYRIVMGVPLKPASPLKSTSPLKEPSALKGASSLKPTSGTPEACFLKPLKPTSDEPSLNHQEPPILNKRVSGELVKVELPVWVPFKEWQDFILHRKAMRNIPFTEAAQALVIKALGSLQAKGHDPATLLNKAIEKGWRTVYEPKGGQQSRARNTPSTETPWAREARQRVEQVSSRIAAKSPANEPFTIDAEVSHAPKHLG